MSSCSESLLLLQCPSFSRKALTSTARGIEERLKALHRDARDFRRTAKKRAKPTTTTTNTPLASISTKCSAEQPKQMAPGIPEPSGDDLVDFRGLAIIPRCYGSLLERACIAHPDLSLYQQ